MAMPVALITGASRGFGRALAEDLARDGWDLVIDARDGTALRLAAGELAAAAPTVRITAIPGDVADPDHRHELVAAAGALGGLDLLVNNASVLGPSPQPRLDAYPLDVLEAVFRVNVVAPLGLVQQALPLLIESSGTIVDITSDAAVEGYEGWGGYGSSKAALEQLSNVLAAEHALGRARLLVRSRRHAYPDAPGRVSGGRHLRPPTSRDGRTPVPSSPPRFATERSVPRE